MMEMIWLTRARSRGVAGISGGAGEADTLARGRGAGSGGTDPARPGERLVDMARDGASFVQPLAGMLERRDAQEVGVMQVVRGRPLLRAEVDLDQLVVHALLRQREPHRAHIDVVGRAKEHRGSRNRVSKMD